MGIYKLNVAVVHASMTRGDTLCIPGRTHGKGLSSVAHSPFATCPVHPASPFACMRSCSGCSISGHLFTLLLHRA